MAGDVWKRLDVLARVTAALVGTLGVSLLAVGALAAHLPMAADLRFAIAFFAFVPMWVTAMTLTFMTRRGWLAWLLCVIAMIILAVAAPDAAHWPSLPT